MLQTANFFEQVQQVNSRPRRSLHLGRCTWTQDEHIYSQEGGKL